MITDYVEAHESCPSLSDLSDLTGISLRHLTRAFKQTTGGTVCLYRAGTLSEGAVAARRPICS